MKNSLKSKNKKNIIPALSVEKTRQLLIKSAISLFAKFGLDGTTVRKIAEEAGVNISLVSYHFQGKEGLYRICLETFGQNRLAAAQRILQTPSNLEEFKIRLEMFAEELIDNYVQEPELVKIIQRESELDQKLPQEIFNKTFLKFFETLVQFLQEAQKSNLIQKDLDVHIAASLFFGSLCHQMKVDSMVKKIHGYSLATPSYRKKIIETALTIYLQGIFPGNSHSHYNENKNKNEKIKIKIKKLAKK